AITGRVVVGQQMTVKEFYRSAKATQHDDYTARLEFLLRGSPKMRAMLPIIRDQVIVYSEKAIIWAMYPAEQVYIAAVLCEVGIDCRVLHGGIDADDREQIISDFTTERTKCMVLICSYGVNSAGLNLQTLCRNVHLFSPALSKATRDQAIGRTCRLGQDRIVLVYDYSVDESFNEYMLSRTKNKAIASLMIEATSF
ncbi:hypothetical protein ETB97_000849, partial [Aspergillus alliaceus]